MDWKWHLKIILILVFFILLIILGSNVSAQRLAMITNQDINPPFFVKRVNHNIVQIDFLGKQYDYSILPMLNRYYFLITSIQNSWVTVKCNLAPRIEYIDYLWQKGVNQLLNDIVHFFESF